VSRSGASASVQARATRPKAIRKIASVEVGWGANQKRSQAFRARVTAEHLPVAVAYALSVNPMSAPPS